MRSGSAMASGASGVAPIVLPSGPLRGLATWTALGVTLLLSGAGLFLEEPAMRLGPKVTPSDALRLAQIFALLLGLGLTAFRYAQKHHRGLDELAMLLFLACGVNLVVQLTGGARSYWQGLYLVLGGLASLAFPRRLVALMVTAVLSIETANWLVHPVPSVLDLVRLALLFLVAVVGYNYMERSERERAERAEEILTCTRR